MLVGMKFGKGTCAYLDLFGKFFGVDNRAFVSIKDSLVKCASIEAVEENIEQTGWG